MARGRMISKSLSTSQKFAALNEHAGPLAEFCQLLYPLLVTHTDDYGRLQGEPFTVKLVVHPSSPRTLAEFSAALSKLQAVELIASYAVDSKQYIQVAHFDQHQQGLHRRTASQLPSPNGSKPSPRSTQSVLDASEKQIADWLADRIERHEIVFSGLTVTAVQREVRRDNWYFDIVCTTREGPLIVIEVKRQRVTRAAIEQVLRYQSALGADTIPVVIGHGLAITKPSDRRVLIATYDDALRLRVVSAASVKSREITLTTLSNVQTEEKRREGNRREVPPLPPLQGGRARKRRTALPNAGSNCPHTPRCSRRHECIEKTIADHRKEAS